MHDRVSVNSLCFSEATFPEQAVYWREIGTHRVGLLDFQLAAEGGLTAAKDALKSGNYIVETIVHPFIAGGHLQADERTWEKPRESLNRAIALAQSVGARSMYMTTGGHGSLSWEEAAASFSAAVAPCVAVAKAANITLMIECAVQPYADLHIAHSLRDTTTLAEMAGIDICVDIFACWQEAGLHETIKRAMPRCHLVQVSDYVYGDRSMPARAVPGDGNIPLKRIIEWLLRAGYRGAFDLELLGPRIDKEGRLSATRRAAEKTSEILTSLGA
jgi:sugar phosphate isomerase/epimerase